MATNQTYNFYRLQGDFTGTASVNGGDYLRLLSEYGDGPSTPGYLSYFNLNGHSTIDYADKETFLSEYDESIHWTAGPGPVFMGGKF